MQLGVITDGISRDFAHSLEVMTDAGLRNAELQFLWDKEVGDLTSAERATARELVDRHGVEVSCISRHVFGGLSVMDTTATSRDYGAHIDALKRCIDMAHEFDCGLVRIMSFRKEMILFGSHGADEWNVATGAWDRLIELIAPAARVAEEADITLVVETGNNAMVTSAHLATKLVEDVGSASLATLWDPCNSLYCHERPFPDGYEAVSRGTLGHIHIKDSLIDIARATVRCAALGDGDMGAYLDDLAGALREDNYDGVVSFESVYRPDGGSFEDGFQASIAAFRRLFDG